MNIEERKILGQKEIVWTGDLSDDCTAEWAGLMLRAEWMNEDYWWWAVYDMQKDEVTIDDSNQYAEKFIGGDIARAKAERVAKKYLSIITNRQQIGKFRIADTFRITGRGLALVGQIIDGRISPGDVIEFNALSYIRTRQITHVEEVRFHEPRPTNTGLIIKCEDDSEIDELRNWKPENVEALVFRSELSGSH